VFAVARNRLPNASKSYGDCLAVHAPGSVAAQERDHLGDFSRLQYPLLRVDGGALVPHLLNADADLLLLLLRLELRHFFF
jgi:hypothetical protein